MTDYSDLRANAACSPDAVLMLIDRLEAAEAVCEAAKVSGAADDIVAAHSEFCIPSDGCRCYEYAARLTDALAKWEATA